MAYKPPAEAQRLSVPANYNDLSFTDIKISRVPASSTEVTPIVVVSLNRPHKYNAFTNKMASELELAYTLFDIDDRIKCIVQTGAGKMFCAGADLDTGIFAPGTEATRDHRDSGGRVVLAIHRCRKPTIAALNGSAVGIGITMTLPMNIRVAWEGAKIGFVFARRGLIMEAASSFYLPRLIGTSKALHLTTTGATYPANHHLLNTLFSETLSSADAVLPRAIEIAQEIVSNCSVVSTHLMKEMMYRNPDTPEGAHLLDSRIIHDLFGGKDSKEGVRAFLEKRPVRFEGTMQNDAPHVYPWWHPIDTSNRPVSSDYVFKPKL